MTVFQDESDPVHPQESAIAQALLKWYAVERRDLPWRSTRDPYPIWLSEVMLQQTQVMTVIPYFQRFLERFPTVRHLAEASLEEVLTLWQGLGYYSRARHLWEGAQFICAQFGGELPQNYVTWLQLPGIGEYTAGAIASITYGERIPAIDGNVRRVMARLLAWDRPTDRGESAKVFRTTLEEWLSWVNPGDFNQALIELGALICLPARPQCTNCPVQDYCKGHALGLETHFPVRKSKPEPQVITRVLFILQKKGLVYLSKRPPRGLLASLWEFPGAEIATEEVPIKHSLKLDGGLRLSPTELRQYYQQAVSDRSYDEFINTYLESHETLEGPVWHTFSHRRWRMFWIAIPLEGQTNKVAEAREISYIQDKGEGVWADLKNLGGIPIPSAFKEVIRRLL